MKKKSALLLSVGFLFLGACNQISSDKRPTVDRDSIVVAKEDILTSDVLTFEEQQKLTPEEVIKRLSSGNKDFTEDILRLGTAHREYEKRH